MLMTKNALKYAIIRFNSATTHTIFYLIIFLSVIFNTEDVCGLLKINFMLNINENYFHSLESLSDN